MLKVLLSYLRLLVNSRDELALSQAINIPYRELAHKQFTALRKVARDKNMPMFQVSTCYVNFYMIVFSCMACFNPGLETWQSKFSTDHHLANKS